MTDYRPITLRKMATKLGISPSYLSEIEHGKKGCSLSLFRKMEEAGYTNKFLKKFQVTMVRLIEG